MTALAGPPGLIRLHGTLVVRRSGWLDVHANVSCPFGHALREHAKFFEGRGVYWCKHRPARNEAECGALIYILVVPGVGKFCADVTTEEMHLMEREHMSGPAVFNYLGIHFPAGVLTRSSRPAQRSA